MDQPSNNDNTSTAPVASPNDSQTHNYKIAIVAVIIILVAAVLLAAYHYMNLPVNTSTNTPTTKLTDSNTSSTPSSVTTPTASNSAATSVVSSNTISSNTPASKETLIVYSYTINSSYGNSGGTIKMLNNSTCAQLNFTPTNTNPFYMPFDCQSSKGTKITLVEIPSSNYSFYEWYGAGPGNYTGTSQTASIIINGNIIENAVFYLPSPAMSSKIMSSIGKGNSTAPPSPPG